MSNEIIVSPKTGLPADLSQISCRETLLKPLDEDFLLGEFQRKLWHREAKAYEGVITILDLEKILNNFLDYDFRFGDWEYKMINFLEFNQDYLDFHIRARKFGLNAQIVIVEDLFQEEHHYPALATYLETYGTFGDYEEHFEAIIIEANRNIVEWNSICTRTIPLVFKRPPMEAFKDMLLDAFWYAAIEEEFNAVKYEYDDCWEAFLDGHPFYPFHMKASIHDNYICFGNFILRFYMKDLDEEKFLVQILLEFKEVEAYLILTEETLNVWEDCFMAHEFDVIIETLLEDALDAIVQWNEYVSRKEKKDERNNRKTNRITG